MAYHSRKNILKNNSYFHAIWRCHNKSFYLETQDEKKFYYDLLVKYKNDYNVEFYSYCIMSNHFHVVGKVSKTYDLSNLFRKVNSLFARYFNDKYGVCGQVIMDRFKSPMIESMEELLNVSRYVELNAYKAKMVRDPRAYKWSSYNHYAFGVEDKLVTENPAYKELGSSDAEKRLNYLSMVDDYIGTSEVYVKKNYSTSLFIGSTKWVEAKYNKLKELRQEKTKKQKLLKSVFIKT